MEGVCEPLFLRHNTDKSSKWQKRNCFFLGAFRCQKKKKKEKKKKRGCVGVKGKRCKLSPPWEGNVEKKRKRIEVYEFCTSPPIKSGCPTGLSLEHGVEGTELVGGERSMRGPIQWPPRIIRNLLRVENLIRVGKRKRSKDQEGFLERAVF